MKELQRLAIAPEQFQKTHIDLTPEQQHYLERVLRLERGDRFIVIHQGGWWLACMGEAGRATVLEAMAVDNELPAAVSLMVALPKQGFDDIVRQATELGVYRIIPVSSDRALLNPSANKLTRWRRIAQEAAEQSERQRVPEILAPMPLLKALQTDWGIWERGGRSYLCVARRQVPHLRDCLPSDPCPMLVATGSEGGWTSTEVEAAIQAGFQPVSLGRRVLRAVTAPLVALSLIASAFEVGGGDGKG